MRVKSSWFEVALIVVFLSGTLYAAFSDAYNLPNTWFIRDDAYYYYKVAQNISEGHGSTFDGIHATNGYHPLWLAICIPIFALARFDLILPLRVLAIVLGVLQVSTAVLLYRLVRDTISHLAAVAAACFWAFNTYVLVFLYKTGVESAVTIFFVLLLLHGLLRLEITWRREPVRLRRIAGLAALAVLAAFGRLDLAFFALIVGIWVVFRGSAVRYLLPIDSLIVVSAAVTAFIARLGFEAYYDVTASVLFMLFGALAIKLPIFFFMGLYRRPEGGSPYPEVIRVVKAVAASSALLAVVLLTGGVAGVLPTISRAVMLLDAAFCLGLLLFIRLGRRLFSARVLGTVAASPTQELAAHWRRWLREGLAFYGVVGGALAAYMLWNAITFGTASPVSGQIKHWWATFTHSIYGSAATSWLTFFAVNPFSEFNAWAPFTNWLSDASNALLYSEGTGYGNPRWQANFALVLAFAGLLLLTTPMLRRRPSVGAVVQTSMIPLFVGACLQVLAYNITGYASAKEWYWLLQPILLLLLGAILFGVLYDGVFRRVPLARYGMVALVSWYGFTAAFGYWRDTLALNPYGAHSRETPYTSIIPFLETNTEPGSLIGMTGGGNVGYLMPDRTVVNMDGLINSYDYFRAMQAGTAADYLYDTGLRYIFANPTILESNPYRGQYSGRFEVLVEWSGKDLLRLLPEPAG